MKTFRFTIVVLLLTLTSALSAMNPIKKGFGMADPHCYIFDGKAYLFTTRDGDKTAKHFIMPDWQIWSSDDLVDWHLERYIYPSETFMGESERCWATETAFKNGKYYFYFSNGNVNTGVLVAESPAGPYEDVLGKPLMDVDLTSTKEYDPTVLVDDDGQAYIVFGHHRMDNPDLCWYIAKLGDDMISLAEAPKEIKLTGTDKYLQANDKPNLHKRDGIYYLSAGSHYAMSTNVYGPYTITGNSGNEVHGLSSRAHGNYFTWNNQWFHTWCHFHLGKEVAYYRESYMTYLHYTDEGHMVSDTDFLEAHFATGVGQYDANWDMIQAEWYMKADAAAKRECPNGGFEIQNVENGATLVFPNIANLQEKKTVNLQLSSTLKSVVEVRANNATGNLLGRIEVSPTGGFDKYVSVSIPLDVPNGVEDICFHFVGKGKDLIHLDYFSFE